VLSGFTTYAFAQRLAAASEVEAFRRQMPSWLGSLPVSSPTFLIALRAIPWVGGTLANNAGALYAIPFWRHFWTRIVVALPFGIVSAYLGSKLMP